MKIQLAASAAPGGLGALATLATRVGPMRGSRGMGGGRRGFAGGRGAGGGGRGGGGRGAARKPAPSQEDLDKELDAYVNKA